MPFAVICLADELYARMVESDVSSPEGAAACARSLSQVLPPPPASAAVAASSSPGGVTGPSSLRDVPFLSEREIVAVLRRLGRLGGPGAALAMRDFLEQTGRGYATGTRAVGAVLLHVAALNASPQAADDVRARMDADGVSLDAECWNRLVYAKAKARDSQAAMKATDEAFAAGVVPDVVTYAALMACLERDAGVLSPSSSSSSSGSVAAGAPPSSSSSSSSSAQLPLEERLRATAQPCVDLWRRMQSAGQKGNEFVHRALVGALCRARDAERALEVVRELYPACAVPPPPASSAASSAAAASASPYDLAFPSVQVAGQLMAGAFRAGNAAVARAGAGMVVDARAAPDAAAAGRPIELVVRTAAGGPSLVGPMSAASRGSRRKRKGEAKSRFRGNNSTFASATFSDDSDGEGFLDGDEGEGGGEGAPVVTGFSNPRAIEASLEDMRLALELYKTLRGRYGAEWRSGSGDGASSATSSSPSSSSSPAPTSRGNGGNGGGNSNGNNSGTGAQQRSVPVVSFGHLMSLAHRLDDADAVAQVLEWAEEDSAAAGAASVSVTASDDDDASASASAASASVPVLGSRTAVRAALVFIGARRWAEAAKVLAGESRARGDGGSRIFGQQCLVLEAAAAAEAEANNPGRGGGAAALAPSLERELAAVKAALLGCLSPEGSSLLSPTAASFGGGGSGGGEQRGGGGGGTRTGAGGAGAAGAAGGAGGGAAEKYSYSEGARRSRTRYSYASPSSSSPSSGSAGPPPPSPSPFSYNPRGGGGGGSGEGASPRAAGTTTTGRSQRLAAAVGGKGGKNVGGGFSLGGNGSGAGRGPQQRRPGPGLGFTPYSSPAPPQAPEDEENHTIPGKRNAGRVAAAALRTAAEAAAEASEADARAQASEDEEAPRRAARPGGGAAAPLPGTSRPQARPSAAVSAADVEAAAARLAATFKAGGISPLKGMRELALIRAAAESLPEGGRGAAAVAVESAEAVLRGAGARAPPAPKPRPSSRRAAE